MDLSNVKRFLPDAELSEMRPCTTPKKVQFHLLAVGRKDFTAKVIDVLKLEKLLLANKSFNDVKSSAELGVVKAVYNGAEISALTSGRVVVKKTADEKQAAELLKELAPLIKGSLFKG